MKKMYLVHSRIERNESIAPQIFLMAVYAPEIAVDARAGQFVMVYLDSDKMLLPRPISLCDVIPSSGMITLVYQIVGGGTAQMSKMKTGESIRLLGPLGNGFLPKGKKNKRFKRVALVGGGIGAPPLYLLAKTLATRGTYADIFLGFRSEPILTEEFQTVADRLFIATEEGGFHHRGLVTDILQAHNRGYDEIMACGPKPLLRSLANFSEQVDVPCQISMEEHMACGLGTCVGCVVKVEGEYVRICCDGPVFYSNEVNFDG